jgi:hypothetical protein
VQLFVSYAHPDRLRAESLSTQLRQAGIEVWLDSDLVGGWPWWDRILGQLRSCDAVVAALSGASIRSNACRSEREYAAQLGKPILPIILERMHAGRLPTDVAPIQTIDYSNPDEAAAIKLIGAVFALPKPGPLPFPLPTPPPLPESPFGNIADRIVGPSLDMDEQLAIIGRLEDALGPTGFPENRSIAAEMLAQMAMRQDLFQNVARRIDNLQKESGTAGWPVHRAPQSQPAPARQTQREASPRPQQERPSGGRQEWWASSNATTGTDATAASTIDGGASENRTTSKGDGGNGASGRGGTQHPPPAPTPVPPAGPAGDVSDHRGMAITSAILTFITILFSPIGIAALFYSSRTRSYLAANDVVAARRASKRVVIAFWVTMGLWFLVIIGASAH